MLRRSISLLALAGLAASGGCKALTDASSSGTPVAVVVLNARTKGTGYTTSPVVNTVFIAHHPFPA